eukprot:6187156-Pleurochrysis_carterae.AAC.5
MRLCRPFAKRRQASAIRACVDGCDDVVTITVVTSCQAPNPSNACDRPAANAASVVTRAKIAHQAVALLSVARSGAVVGGCVFLATCLRL